MLLPMSYMFQFKRNIKRLCIKI